ncbi:hypothetical protein M5D96_005924, partial [Drosophila gunungcola]
MRGNTRKIHFKSLKCQCCTEYGKLNYSSSKEQLLNAAGLTVKNSMTLIIVEQIFTEIK